MDKKEAKIIKASLMAGLSLWGLPNFELRKGDKRLEIVRKYANIFGINLNIYKKIGGSGLIWGWDERSKINKQKISERIEEEIDNIGAENVIDYPCPVDDFEYVFTLNGTGYTGYSTKEKLFDPSIRDKDGKLYTYWAGDEDIFIYKMDMKTVKEAKKFARKALTK